MGSRERPGHDEGRPTSGWVLGPLIYSRRAGTQGSLAPFSFSSSLLSCRILQWAQGPWAEVPVLSDGSPPSTNHRTGPQDPGRGDVSAKRMEHTLGVGWVGRYTHSTQPGPERGAGTGMLVSRKPSPEGPSRTSSGCLCTASTGADGREQRTRTDTSATDIQLPPQWKIEMGRDKTGQDRHTGPHQSGAHTPKPH